MVCTISERSRIGHVVVFHDVPVEEDGKDALGVGGAPSIGVEYCHRGDAPGDAGIAQQLGVGFAQPVDGALAHLDHVFQRQRLRLWIVDLDRREHVMWWEAQLGLRPEGRHLQGAAYERIAVTGPSGRGEPNPSILDNPERYTGALSRFNQLETVSFKHHGLISVLHMVDLGLAADLGRTFPAATRGPCHRSPLGSWGGPAYETLLDAYVGAAVGHWQGRDCPPLPQPPPWFISRSSAMA